MAIKTYKPTSAGRRFVTTLTYSELSGDKPERSLMHDQRKSGGRNNAGRITTRHIGGGNRRKYRIIDFKRQKDEDLKSSSFLSRCDFSSDLFASFAKNNGARKEDGECQGEDGYVQIACLRV